MSISFYGSFFSSSVQTSSYDNLLPCSQAYTIIVQLTYGLKVTSDDDDLIVSFGEFLRRSVSEGPLGASMIDFFPFCKSSAQQSIRGSELKLRSEVYPVMVSGRWLQDSSEDHERLRGQYKKHTF